MAKCDRKHLNNNSCLDQYLPNKPFLPLILKPRDKVLPQLNVTNYNDICAGEEFFCALVWFDKKNGLKHIP